MMYSNWFAAERNFRDPFRFDQKSGAAAYFRGGLTDPGTGIKNQRIRICASMWADEVGELLHGDDPWAIDCQLVISNASSNVAKLGGVSVPLNSQTVGWHDALKYKYLLSMDGHGPTCSRVFEALLNINFAEIGSHSSCRLGLYNILRAW